MSDVEIVSAVFHLYEGGLVVEPSEAAAFAALVHGKVPEIEGKKVVTVITGSNIAPEDVYQLSNCVSYS